MTKRSRFAISVFAVGLFMALAPQAFAASGTIEKDCDGVHFFGNVGSGEMVKLEVRLHATAVWTSPRIQDDIITVGPGPFDVIVPWVEDPSGQLNRTAISVSTNDASYQLLVINEDFLYCATPTPTATPTVTPTPTPTPTPGGGEGCTPGYWKNHLSAWAATGFNPADDFDTTFGVDLFSPDITLQQAVRAKGGGVKKLARHGTAALLSAAHPSVNYPYTISEVIALVQSGDSDSLGDANELGCSIP
jgi:hypothetical protein